MNRQLLVFVCFILITRLALVSVTAAPSLSASHESAGSATPLSSPITAEQYCAFLNVVASTDEHQLYCEQMSSDPLAACIVRSGNAGTYEYSVIAGKENACVPYLTWFDAARYCNWMNNNQPTIEQDATAIEEGAYTLNGIDNTSSIVPKNPNATYFIAGDENTAAPISYLLSPISQFDPLLACNQVTFSVATSSSNLTLWSGDSDNDTSEYSIGEDVLIGAGIIAAIVGAGCEIYRYHYGEEPVNTGLDDPSSTYEEPQARMHLSDSTIGQQQTKRKISWHNKLTNTKLIVIRKEEYESYLAHFQSVKDVGEKAKHEQPGEFNEESRSCKEEQRGTKKINGKPQCYKNPVSAPDIKKAAHQKLYLQVYDNQIAKAYGRISFLEKYNLLKTEPTALEQVLSQQEPTKQTLINVLCQMQNNDYITNQESNELLLSIKELTEQQTIDLKVPEMKDEELIELLYEVKELPEQRRIELLNEARLHARWIAMGKDYSSFDTSWESKDDWIAWADCTVKPVHIHSSRWKAWGNYGEQNHWFEEDSTSTSPKTAPGVTVLATFSTLDDDISSNLDNLPLRPSGPGPDQ